MASATWEVAVRYGLILPDQKPVAFDVGLGVGIPSGNQRRDLGEGRLTLEPFFTGSTWLGPINTQLNCGWQRRHERGGRAA